MAISRRHVLAAGGGTFALVCAGGLWRVMRSPQTATEPWADLATPEPDVRLDAFRHAILAPNPHNRQPWLIRMEGRDKATIFCDLDRRLPMTDPHDRQITIGFGAFLELARIAAARRGMALEIAPFPEGAPEDRLDSRPIATLRLAPGGQADPLFSAIAARRSNKQAYDLSRPVTVAQLESLRGLADAEAGFTVDLSEVAAIRTLVLRAVTVEMQLPRTHRESVDLMRIGAREVDANPDGIDLDGPMIEALSATAMLTRDSLADPTTEAFRSGETMMAETYGSAPAFLWINTPGNSRQEQLVAGRRYVRMNLAATAAGLSMHPMSQSLQEYPEMAPILAGVHALLAPGGERVQMLARIGHGAAVPPAPRWPLEAKLLPGA